MAVGQDYDLPGEHYQMNITLIENALDFILSAVEWAKGDDDRSLKYAILNLSDGVELILKERLRRAHWSLLFVLGYESLSSICAYPVSVIILSQVE